MKTIRKSENMPLTTSRRPVPKSWKKVAGLLRGRKKQLEKHVATTRNEWGG